MVLDNIIRPQQYMIDKRKRYQWLPQPSQRTDNCAAQKGEEVTIDENGKPIPIPREKQKRGCQNVIRSSARGCAEKLGISQGKANKLLNTNKFYFRKQSYNVIPGFSHEKLAKTKLMNPFSVVYGVMRTNSIIIHHGSILSPRIVLPSHSSIMYIG